MSFSVSENCTARLVAQIKDEANAPLGSAAITTLLLTLYNRATSAIINSRNKQNVLNANGVTVDASGNLVWIMTPADNAILDSTKASEYHVALFEWTYAAGVKRGITEILIAVTNLTLNP